MRDHHVRRDGACDVQERAQLASRPRPSLREHPHRSLRQQGKLDDDDRHGRESVQSNSFLDLFSSLKMKI